MQKSTYLKDEKTTIQTYQKSIFKRKGNLFSTLFHSIGPDSPLLNIC